MLVMKSMIYNFITERSILLLTQQPNRNHRKRYQNDQAHQVRDNKGHHPLEHIGQLNMRCHRLNDEDIHPHWRRD